MVGWSSSVNAVPVDRVTLAAHEPAGATDDREQAQAVTAGGEVAESANHIGELAGQITEAVRGDDRGSHAMLGTQYYDELKVLLTKCHPQG